MLLPYRSKNPPERFPVVTIGLIVVNVIVFAFTVDPSTLSVSKEAIQSLSVSHNNMWAEPWRIITAMFLHGSILHIAGNMLFLWLFGAATEGRLRPARFIVMYLAAGICGDVLEDLVWGMANPDAPALGASGAIMGVAGAYLYLFPYSKISVFYWLGFFWRGVWDCEARWVVAFYVGQDVLLTLLYRGADGVGHLAHIGGFGAGILIVMLMRARRDSADVSEVQAIQADVKDYSLLSRSDLEILLQQPTDNMMLVMAYLEKATGTYSDARPEGVLHVLGQYASPLIEQVDPERLAYVVLRIPISAGGMHPIFYLRLGSRLERKYSNDLATQIYRRVYDLAPTAPDTEMALYRLAQIMETAYGNHAQALAIYQEMLRLFPAGEMSQAARGALQSG